MTSRCLLGCALALGVVHTTHADAPRLEYRVVFASGRALTQQLDSVARDGYACVAVARPDPGVAVPGVVVVVGRPSSGARPAVAHRVVTLGYRGADLQARLDQAGADGFRMCGMALDESRSTAGVVVAVLAQDATTAAAPSRYGVEVLTNYKASLARLATAGKDGFVPVAAAPVDNNRVPEMRSWMVVTERLDGAPRDIAVRSGSGSALDRNLNEQGKQGYAVDLVWQEGNDVVAMMSRPAGNASSAHVFAIEARGPDRLRFLKGRYLGDYSSLSGGDRLVISDTSQPRNTDVQEDPLPNPGALGYVDPSAMGTIGDHISRYHGFAPAFVRIRGGERGALVLTTVLTQPR